VRALQKAAAADRIAATWFSASAFSIDVNLTDGAAHQVSAYVVDWGNQGRAQTLEVRDAVSGALLDTRSMSGFSEGRYYAWSIRGHAEIRVVNNGGINAVVSGLFFDNPASGSGTSATFVSTDTTTQGSWKGVKGADGFAIANDATSLPAYATATIVGQANWTWEAATTNVRALQKAAAADRIAATWFSASAFSIDVNLTDGVAHQVSVYVVDWGNQGRAQTLEVRDAVSGALLDTRSMSGFSEVAITRGRSAAMRRSGWSTTVASMPSSAACSSPRKRPLLPSEGRSFWCVRSDELTQQDHWIDPARPSCRSVRRCHGRDRQPDRR
jgi:hypothetical protein